MSHFDTSSSSLIATNNYNNNSHLLHWLAGEQVQCIVAPSTYQIATATWEESPCPAQLLSNYAEWIWEWSFLPQSYSLLLYTVSWAISPPPSPETPRRGCPFLWMKTQRRALFQYLNYKLNGTAHRERIKVRESLAATLQEDRHHVVCSYRLFLLFNTYR